jgi:hypothetical protein
MISRKFRLTRLWSNKELRKIASFFSGDIVNVSGWDDRDKEGGNYKKYFKNASNYYYTNYPGERGTSNLKNEFFCDLSKDLSAELENRFDVVFNHTTLEHIFDVRKAFSNICKMSKDIVIIVVPFCQAQHETMDWKDYWRFTPSAMRELYKENGLDIIYESASEYTNSAIYLFYVGSKNSDKWNNSFLINNKKELGDCGKWIGESLTERIKKNIKRILR